MVPVDFAWIFVLPVLAVGFILLFWFVMSKLVELFQRIFS